MAHFNRRELFRRSALSAAGLALLGSGCLPSQRSGGGLPQDQKSGAPAPTGNQAYLAIAHGTDPAGMVRAALGALGGMGRFVKAGQDVIIKPNMCVDYHPPEYAATTNPDVVAALVTLCREAGAKRVRVMDSPFAGIAPRSAFAATGIEAAVQAAGGEMEVMSAIKFASYKIPQGKSLTSWKFYPDALEADVLINVPIAKQHSLARLTLGGKNLLGVVADANQLHMSLAQRIADLLSLIRPTLTVIDAYRVLMDHGPTGGSLNDVRQANTIIASHDTIAADAQGATLFDLTGADVPSVKIGADMGLGTLDLAAVKVEDVNV